MDTDVCTVGASPVLDSQVIAPHVLYIIVAVAGTDESPFLTGVACVFIQPYIGTAGSGRTCHFNGKAGFGGKDLVPAVSRAGHIEFLSQPVIGLEQLYIGLVYDPAALAVHDLIGSKR